MKRVFSSFILLLIFANLGFSQFTTPTIDGSIGESEYGNHTIGQNAYIVDSKTWYVTWDDTHLFVGVEGHTNFNDAIVLYIDIDPQVPVNSGTNANGTSSGTGYDGVTPTFPFRADFFAYVKTDYDDYKTDNASNGWSSSTTASLAKNFNDGNDVGEFSIPWTAITGSSRPSSFNFVGFMSYTGGTFARMPSSNPAGTSPDFVRYYTVSSTADNSSTLPFSQESYCHIGNDVTGFGSITVFDFTMNTSGKSITRANDAGGEWNITNDLLINSGTIHFGSSTDLVNVTGNVTISADGTIILSSAIGGDLKVGGNWIENGTFTPNDRAVFFINGNPQSITGAKDPINFDYLFVEKTAATTLTFDQNVSINDKFNQISGNATIASGKSLTIGASAVADIASGSTLTTNGNLILSSDINGTGSLIVNGTIAGSGTITSNRYLAGTEVWRLISSPVASQSISGTWTPAGSYPDASGYDFYAYQESSATWLNQKVGANSITSFTPGQGYLVSYQEENPTKSFEGELNNGDVPISVSKSGTGDYAGANLIGNPYPSGIDWNDADRSLFSDDFAYVYDRVSNDGETYEGYALVDGSVADAFIAPHQGFFVIKDLAGSSDFTFTNAMRAHGGTFTKAPANFAGLKLKVSNGSYYDIATININETASFDRDRMDAIKFYSNNANMPNFYTISKDSKQLAINTIPAIEIEEPIILGVTIPANGNYEISLIEQGADFADKVIYLEDLLTGIRHNLTTDGSYNYSASTSDDPNRFLLHFGVVGVGEQEQASTLQAYMVDNRLYVNNSLELAQLAVYDLQGRLVAEQSLNTAGLQALPLELPAGVYIVRLNNASESRSLKINVQ